jgi:hypothetical protein
LNGNGGGGCGTIFKLTESAGQWSESVINVFGLLAYDISDPGPLLWTSSHVLFGAGGGGVDGNGAVFQIDLNKAPQLSAVADSHRRPTQWRLYHSPASGTQSGKGGN